MKNKVMLGLWRFIINVPPNLIEKQMAKTMRRFESESRKFTAAHRTVHHCVVREMPSVDGPLSPEMVADKVNLPVEQVNALLNDLEKGMTYLVRDQRGHVVWAFPMTVEKTPHRLTFNTGEQAYAA